jgi:shikimate dehydrogenase
MVWRDDVSEVKLGLIGDNISRSKAPLLHRLAGRMCGVDVRYDRLIPKEIGKEFDAVFDDCGRNGYRGINVTYPYKERAAAKVSINDPIVQSIGAVNTVVFTPAGPKGFNTDYSGFIAGFRGVLGGAAPGAVCMIGAGGVGIAVAFGLIVLGLEELRIVERDLEKAAALAESLRTARPSLTVTVTNNGADAAIGAAGLINCTPVGMVGYEGTPLPRNSMHGARWAFDAVYTPIETQFLRDASDEGLTIVSGYELFFHQGVDAWDIFVGRPLDHDALRKALAEETVNEEAG